MKHIKHATALSMLQNVGEALTHLKQTAVGLLHEKEEMLTRLETMGANLAAALARAEQAEHERDDLLARVKRAELARWKAEADQEREVNALRGRLRGALIKCGSCNGETARTSPWPCLTCASSPVLGYIPAEEQ
jgi:multidrug resistance efflux pump